LQTNSYQATRLSLEPQGLSVEEVNRAKPKPTSPATSRADDHASYRNILIITGDPPANPDEDSFFRYSSVKLIKRINQDHPDHFLLACI